MTPVLRSRSTSRIGAAWLPRLPFVSSVAALLLWPAQPIPRWSFVPEVRIGADMSGEVALTNVVAAFPDTSGEGFVFVATIRDGLQQFDRSGRLMRTFGPRQQQRSLSRWRTVPRTAHWPHVTRAGPGRSRSA
jgi:hypothetical protein